MTHYHARIHSYGNNYSTPGHRPECDCGWADPTTYPLGWYDAARAALIRHQETHQ